MNFELTQANDSISENLQGKCFLSKSTERGLGALVSQIGEKSHKKTQLQTYGEIQEVNCMLVLQLFPS